MWPRSRGPLRGPTGCDGHRSRSGARHAAGGETPHPAPREGATTSKVPPRRSRFPRVPLRSCGRSPPCTTGRTSTPGSGKYAGCSSPAVVSSPWSGGHNPGPGVTGATAGRTSRPRPSPIGAVSTALAMFVWSGRRSAADRRSAWSPARPDGPRLRRPLRARRRCYLRALTSTHPPSSRTASTDIPTSWTARAKSSGFQIENQRLPLGMSSAHPVTPAVLTDRLRGALALATLASSRSAIRGVFVREVDQRGARPDGVAGSRTQRQRSKVAQDDRTVSSSPIGEVSIQVNPDGHVALSGEASQVAPRTTTRIEHSRGGLEACREGGEGTGDRRRTESGKGVWIVGVGGHALGDDID